MSRGYVLAQNSTHRWSKAPVTKIVTFTYRVLLRLQGGYAAKGAM